MISRLTDSTPENERPTVPSEVLVEITTHGQGQLSDIAPVGYAGAAFYPEDGLLVLSYQKFGETYADPEDEENPVEYADTGLGLLTVDRVVELVLEGAVTDEVREGDPARARAWVLSQIEHS